MHRVHLSVVAALPLFVVFQGCMRPAVRADVNVPAQVDIAQLWVEPMDPGDRGLLYGPGGQDLLPDHSMPFEFVAEDRTGYSPGYDVRDAEGVTWSVKMGPEAQPEVAVSRLLWAIGFHQPPIYYVPSWTLSGEKSGVQPAARFRPDLRQWKAVDEWSWYENAFVSTQPFKGLVVANLMMNNWDWKTSNNRIYEVQQDQAGGRERVYVVRDLGASLGKTSFPRWLNFFPMRGLGQGSRNDLEDFESQGFIKRVEGDRVEFFYRGIHGNLVDTLSRADVVWTCRLMSRLSDTQWLEAFRAAGYSDEQVRRYTAKMKAKVAEGLQLAKG